MENFCLHGSYEKSRQMKTIIDLKNTMNEKCYKNVNEKIARKIKNRVSDEIWEIVFRPVSQQILMQMQMKLSMLIVDVN